MINISKENKGCITSFVLYMLGLGFIVAFILALNTWGQRNPVEYCDELSQELISKNNVKVCKLRYPILNTDEIKAIKEKNKKLEEKNDDLEFSLDDIKDNIKQIEEIIEDIKKEIKGNNEFN